MPFLKPALPGNAAVPKDQTEVAYSKSDTIEDKAGAEHAELEEFTAGQDPPTEAELKAVRWKIDLRLMPIMSFTYAIQYYDKSALNQASLFGIMTDLGLTQVVSKGPPVVVNTNRFSYVSMVFYCGYILGVYPAVLLAQRFRAAKTCATLVLVWGIVATMTVVCSNFAGIMTERFFLGMCEAGIAPTFVIASGQWYTPAESTYRIAIWWTSNTFVAMFGPLISYGLGSIDGALPGWKNIYLYAGLLTFCWAFVVFWLLPDDPTTAKFLTERERFVALERVRNNNAGIVNHRIKWKAVREAVTDPAVWLMSTMTFCSCTSNTISGTFSSIIIKNLGFSTFNSLLLQIPPGVLGLILGFGPTLFILKTNKWRLLIFAILMATSLCGTAILFAVDRSRTGIVLVGYYFNSCYVICPAIMLGLSAANIAGHTKKSTTNAMVFMSYCCGSIMGPLIFHAQDNYRSGFQGILVCQTYAIIASQVLYVLYRRRNAKRDAMYGEQKRGEPFTDLTDFANTNFRYSG